VLLLLAALGCWRVDRLGPGRASLAARPLWTMVGAGALEAGSQGTEPYQDGVA
jgi:hypothetical protein